VACAPWRRATRRESARQQFCGEIDIRIGRDRYVFYHGFADRPQPLVKLFASCCGAKTTVHYWLVTPADAAELRLMRCRLRRRVNEAGAGPAQTLTFRTNLG